MPVEIIRHQKEYEYGDGQIVKKTLIQKIWHMPDGLSDELPAANNLDMDGCIQLLGIMLKGEKEDLEYYYDFRKHKRWKKKDGLAQQKAAKYEIEYNIKRSEKFFRSDPFCSGLDGDAIIDQCRRNVYEPKWKNHPDFKKGGEK